MRGIGDVGKSTVYIRKYNAELDDKERDEYNEYIAISTRCMHLGCPVRFVAASERFICPCHGGVYDFQGRSTAARPCARSIASTRACAAATSRSGRGSASTPS